MEDFANNSSAVQKAILAIKDAINGITCSLEENVNGITHVTESTTDIVGSMAKVSEDAEENADISKKIQKEVSIFKY